MTDDEDGTSWVELGVIARPHGVRGELRVHLFNPDSTLLEELGEVFLKPQGQPPSRVGIAGTRRGPKALLMRLAGVESREDADALRGSILCVPRAALPELEEGEFYLADLIGLVAYEGSRPIGSVVEVLDYPSVECLRVQIETGYLEVPMLPRWLERIDLADGKVYLKDLEDIPVERPR